MNSKSTLMVGDAAPEKLCRILSLDGGGAKGFYTLGVTRMNEETIYIYDVNYDIEMLHVRIRKWGGSTKYIVNSALWPALKVTPGDRLRAVQ